MNNAILTVCRWSETAGQTSRCLREGSPCQRIGGEHSNGRLSVRLVDEDTSGASTSSGTSRKSPSRRYRNPVSAALDPGEEAGHDVFRLVGLVLALLEELVEADTVVDLKLSKAATRGTARA